MARPQETGLSPAVGERAVLGTFRMQILFFPSQLNELLWKRQDLEWKGAQRMGYLWEGTVFSRSMGTSGVGHIPYPNHAFSAAWR